MKLKNRIRFLQQALREKGIAAALLSYSRDVFYYTGTAQPSYFVVLPDEYFLFIKSGFEFAINEVFIPKERVREERNLENIYKKIFSKLSANKKIGTELDILPAVQLFRLKKIFPNFEFVNISPVILEQRKKKDSDEIRLIEKACEVLHTGHDAILENLKEGTTELELASAVENAHRLAGHEGIFFIRQPDFFMSRGPIASGPNLFKNSGVVYTITGVGLSPSVPAGPSRRPITKGDLVIVDIPTLVNGYHADQTRTYFLGKVNTQIKTMYHHLKEIADYLIENIRPQMKCSEIYQLAIEKSKNLEVKATFLSFGRGKKSRIIGHGVGLELNEPPTLADYDHSEVSDGFVLALDMHMMDKNIGVVKLEDMILIADNGNKVLTKTPRHLFEL
jgi:Xaa-Pro aminopeptidase